MIHVSRDEARKAPKTGRHISQHELPKQLPSDRVHVVDNMECQGLRLINTLAQSPDAIVIALLVRHDVLTPAKWLEINEDYKGWDIIDLNKD